LEPDHGSSDRQCRAIHRAAARRGDSDGLDDPGVVPRHGDRGTRARRMGRGAADAADTRRERMTIAPLDWAVLVVYLIAITGIGLIVGYRVRRSAEYFLGERRFGAAVMIAQSFSVGTHAEMPVSLAGAVYGIGASAI